MDITTITSHWKAVRAGLYETITRFADTELDFKPFPASWSAKQIMLHIAQEEYGEFAYGITQEIGEFPPEYNPEEYSNAESIQTLLETVNEKTLAYISSLKDADLKRVIATPWGARYALIEMIGHMIEHEIHHRGELSLILGMLGKKGFDA
jgi:uncharacterized damage-inducible protein DinB